MVFDEWWLEENPYRSYNDAHATVDDTFPHAWISYWGIGAARSPEHLDVDTWQEAQSLFYLAQRLVRAAAALSGAKLPEAKRTLPAILRREAESERSARIELLEALRNDVDLSALDGSTWPFLEQHLRSGDGPAGQKERLFQTATEIHAWALFGSSPRGVARRCIELLDYLVRCKGLRSREYLGRVASCYVRGMGPELAVMSRAVLEAALQNIDALETRAESVRRAKGKPYDSLADWLDAATEAGALDEEGRLAAERVRQAGDAAVHKAPGLAPPEQQVLEALSLALQQLESFSKK